MYPDTPFLDLNQSLESFNLLVTDLDTVEKQMASLLNTYESISSGINRYLNYILQFSHLLMKFQFRVWREFHPARTDIPECFRR
jgi:hypothetical protein